MRSDWPLILAYHHIVDGRESRYALDAETFERGLAGLLDRGFEPVPLEGALAAVALDAEASATKTFAVTFDDGLTSFKQLAAPALERLGLLGMTTVFVPTAFVGGDNAWRDDELEAGRKQIARDPAESLMSWDDLAEISAAGVSVESHGHRHLAMDRIPYADALEDASESRRQLLDRGFDARYFALPYGWYSADAKRAIADAGFEAALSVTHGGHDRFDVRRVPVYGTDNALTAWLKRSGWYFAAFDTAAHAVGKGRT